MATQPNTTGAARLITELVEDITVTMITGSIQAVLDKYGTSHKKL